MSVNGWLRIHLQHILIDIYIDSRSAINTVHLVRHTEVGDSWLLWGYYRAKTKWCGNLQHNNATFNCNFIDLFLLRSNCFIASKCWIMKTRPNDLEKAECSQMTLPKVRPQFSCQENGRLQPSLGKVRNEQASETRRPSSSHPYNQQPSVFFSWRAQNLKRKVKKKVKLKRGWLLQMNRNPSTFQDLWWVAHELKVLPWASRSPSINVTWG